MFVKTCPPPPPPPIHRLKPQKKLWSVSRESKSIKCVDLLVCICFDLPSLLITLLSFYIGKTQTSDSLVACLTNEAGSSKLCIIFSFAFKIVSYMFSSVTGCFSSLGLVLTWANSLSSASVTSLAAALILLLKSSSSVATWKRQCSSTLYYNDQDLKLIGSYARNIKLIFFSRWSIMNSWFINTRKRWQIFFPLELFWKLPEKQTFWSPC